jgi:beta-glucosidase
MRQPLSRSALAGVPALAVLAGLIAVPAPALGADPPLPAAPAPYRDPALPVEQRVSDLLGRMTLLEKVGQMTQADRGQVADDPTRVRRWALGSVLSTPVGKPVNRTPKQWADLVDGLQAHALNTRLGIPMIYGVDAVHGHGNVQGATLFPHNVGIGASRDPQLARAVGAVTAQEVRATGIPWVFAPCLCVSRDERWGRSYEAFGEDPGLVRQMTVQIDGLQGSTPAQLRGPEHVLATAKHFAGDGHTVYGTGISGYPIDRGITRTTRAAFERIDLAPFVTAVRQHRLGSVMPSYSRVDFTDEAGGPVPLHAHRQLLTGVLKNELGFDGFVVSDYRAVELLPGDYRAQVGTAVNAGVDMVMAPTDAVVFQQTLVALVQAGAVPRARVDDAVARILRAKVRLGLFERPYADRRHLDEVGGAAHRAVARRAAAQSQVLLKNAGRVLPLSPDARVYVAGRNADDLGNQLGGWSRTWQGLSGGGRELGTTILQGIRQVAPRARVTYSRDASAPTVGSTVGIVVVGETPYAEGYGDVGGPRWVGGGTTREPKLLTLQPQDRKTVEKVCRLLPTCVVLVVSGRPQVLADQLPGIDALVASWLPGTEGEGVADVLFGRRPFTGQLPVTWPRSARQVPINVGDARYDPQFPYGWGLRADAARGRLDSAATAAAGTQDPGLSAALGDVGRAGAAAGWGADGRLGDPAAVLPLLQQSADRLQASPADTASLQSAVVSVVRDLAQDAVVEGTAAPDAARLIADADVALSAGRSGDAVRQLTRALP